MESTAGYEQLAQTIKHYWGYDDFRPLQREAMECVLSNQDSVVVLPTGGGKSLCYQVPALCKDGLAIVVSPLISLMKDQVDALRSCGIAAACVNSSMTADERRKVADEIRAGRLKILYLAPEKLLTPRMLEFLKDVQLSFVAIDEAHCISEWGHDFRPEYRELKSLRELFPETAFHTYTATATEPVREDIARQLELKNHRLLVGSFDRPNLIYRVERRNNRLAQIAEVIARYPNDSGIVYCIRRADVEEISSQLNQAGYRSLPYHAGLSDHERKSAQDDSFRTAFRRLWPPSRSAWGSTNPTCDTSYTPACRSRWKAINRKAAAPAVTDSKRNACCCIPAETSPCGNGCWAICRAKLFKQRKFLWPH
jgi:ATP-dependent DNA helicase RecQ